ncbi:hypothetical protein HDU93_006073 [Gonapodya sp. JEL0774]|nr:hypothetical protein HDU93_006073 [Gonapodya sp. JEL0774]
MHADTNEDDNPRGGLKSSKGDAEATLKQKVLRQGTVLIEEINMAKFAGKKSDYQTASAPTSATVHPSCHH